MTQVATQITLSVADRVRDWSRQERNLAMALRGLHAVPSPPPAPLFPLPNAALFVPVASPLVIGEPVPWIPLAGSFGAEEVAHPETAAPSTVQMLATDAPVDAHQEHGAPYFDEATTLAMPTVAGLPDPPPGPFDQFITAVTAPGLTPPATAARLPPPSRFMVRVAQVGQPHRPTKRNYDYFEELNVRLAAQSAAQQQGSQH